MQTVSEKIDKNTISTYFRNLQDHITLEMERSDGSVKFKEESWERPGGGGGRSRIIQNGRIFEKGGVNFSEVYGALSDKASSGLQVQLGQNFFATGVSIVLHPNSPMIPITHMNVRYFELSNGTKWFGGGIDLTPIYINVDQARSFHQNLKTICDRHDRSYYPEFKKNADEYFFIKHRNETRGIGGIFFDRLMKTPEISIEDRFSFVKDVGDSFSSIYTHLIDENRNAPFGDREKQWQFVRRGRYAEFNLIYDKGTKFGLDTDGRIESIFMSLPPVVNWPYHFQIEDDGEESRTQNLLVKNLDWLRLQNS